MQITSKKENIKKGLKMINNSNNFKVSKVSIKNRRKEIKNNKTRIRSNKNQNKK